MPSLVLFIISMLVDRYSKRWRQAHLLANSFWKRWLSEYLPSLQLRQERLQLKRNMQAKDLVLMVDKRCSSGQWPLAIVEKVFPDMDGVVLCHLQYVN